MLQKTKLIIIGLGLLFFISVIINLQVYRAQRIAEQERQALQGDNSSLNKQLETAKGSNRQLDEQLSQLKRDVERIQKEKEEVARRYEMVNKEKEELIEKLKAKASQQVEEKKPTAPPSAGEEAYWAGVLKTKTDLELQLATLKSELKDLQITSEQLNREKGIVDLELKNFTRENQDLKQKVAYDQKVIDSISQELVREKSSKMQLEESAKFTKSENNVLRKQLRSLSSRKIDLERKVDELQTRSRSIEDNYSKLETILKEKILQLGEFKKQMDATRPEGLPQQAPVMQSDSVELPPIVVRPQQQDAYRQESTQRTAEVLLVNRENNFVVISFGDESGLKVGDILQVYRDARPIASIEVIQLRRNFSACDIKREDVSIKVGDKVK
jgi:chromosome segregation ATPase